MARELLTLQNLAKYYTTAQSVVVGLNQTNLTFCRGEFVAITGESGSGKSTLAHVLGGILPYESGELLYKGKPTSHYDSADWERYRRDCVSFISQSYGILPGSSVQDNVTCALRLTGVDKAEAQKKAEEILKKVELWELRHRRAAKLSSGQKQRLSIARALAKSAPVLIADEPTGNLDAENSAMVIALLAEAAKDRLVILITHEFSEAADVATRHIELHDGRVTMDVQLREVPALPEAKLVEKRQGKKRHLSWFVARFQIKARPVWAVLMLCLFAATVFAMFAISGTFISNLDDTFTYYYDNSAFRNGDPRRIVVGRIDGEDLTGEDVDKLLPVKYVDSVEEYGYVTDVQYAYREGVDYEIKNNLVAVGDGDFAATENYSLKKYQNNMPFVRTVPALQEGEAFLTAGRMPESLYEVVAVGGEERLDQKITVLIQDQKNWGVDSFIRIEVTVVGVTDRGSHLYFHEDLGKMMLAATRSDTHLLYMPIHDESVIVGRENISFSSDGYKIMAYYKYIAGDVTERDEAVDVLCLQAVQIVWGTMETMDDFVRDFSLDGDTVSRFVFLRTLGQYATFWEMGDELQTVMKEVGLDDDTVFAREGDWSRYVGDILWDREVSGRLRSVAEPLFQEFQELYTQKKEAFLAQAMNATTLEELGDILTEWWGERELGVENWVSTNGKLYFPAVWGRMPDIENIHPIQPGKDVVVAPSMLNGLATQQAKEKPMYMGDDMKDAEFIKYQFPILGALGDPNIEKKDQYKEMTVLGSMEVGHHQAVLLHPDDFEEMVYPGKGDQVSVYAEDYAYVDRILEDIHALGYGALSPYQEGAVTQNEELAAQRTQTLRVCIIALLAVIALQILLLRAMFSMETESYRLLSHIGLNGVTAKRSVLWQILTFALGGQILGVGLIGACAAGGVDQLVHILRYLPLSYRVGLCLLHLGASVFTAVWTMKALEKQVFPQSGSEPDLDWDVLEEEVEA